METSIEPPITKVNLLAYLNERASLFTEAEAAILRQAISDFRLDFPYEKWPPEQQVVWSKAIDTFLLFDLCVASYLIGGFESPLNTVTTVWPSKTAQ